MNNSNDFFLFKYFIRVMTVVLMLSSSTIYAQASISKDDYQRAVNFLRKNLIGKKAFNLHIEPHFLNDKSGLWYIHQSPGSKKYLKLNFKKYSIKDLFDHQKLATNLTEYLNEKVNADSLPISEIIQLKNNNLRLKVKDQYFILDGKNNLLKDELKKPSADSKSILSPDETYLAYSKDYNLFIKSTMDSVEHQLSTDGKKAYEYASWYGWGDIIEGENGNRPHRFGLEWSKDSQWIFANIVDLRNAQKMYLLDWSVDSLYRPKLLSYYRGSPGDSTMVYLEPRFFNIKSGKEIKLKLDRKTHINPINIEWSKDPNIIYLYSMSRGYQNVSILKFNLLTENISEIYSESSQTNIDNFDYTLSEENGFLILLSEKDGMRQLYKIDLETNAEHKFEIGKLYVNSILKISDKEDKIYFMASGSEENNNPYQQSLYSISFDGTNFKRLTKENLHHIVNISDDNKYFVDNMSDVRTPTRSVLRSLSDGKILKEISRATLKGLDSWSAPEVFTTLARDGKTINYGALWKPTNFDPSKKYPLIELSYTGPHHQIFPKNFSQAFVMQSYAELGFIGMVFDGLGSAGRSKAYHNHSYKNLGGNLEDHVLAINYLGSKFDWIDTNRVGIFGHSAGGYDAAHALLAYPDTYKVAVASSADHDHRMEKAWWPEMYMGWPVDSAYHQQSNITMAPNLKGKLLITHGGIDENVNPSATFKLAEALIKSDKQFDMMIFPSQRHGYRDKHLNYFTKLRWNYFVEHLRELEPIWDFKL